MTPKIAPSGGFADAADYRARFPDGRIGSDPSQATPEKGAQIVAVAKQALMTSFKLCGGMLVAMPTAIPDEPLIKRFGTRVGKTVGSVSVSS